MKAARLHAINNFRIDEIPVPKPKGEQLLIRVGACGICGSDIPRIFELGTSNQDYPLTLGHEFAGEIAAVGEDADETMLGKRGVVFPCIPCRACNACLTANYAMCLDYDYLGSRSDGGFADYCLIPSAWHFVESKNASSGFEALCMLEPCTVAQHTLRKGGLVAGNSLVIFGAGPIGIMIARWARIFGAGPVVLVDILDEKVQFANKRGEMAINCTKSDVNAYFKSINNGRPPDICIEGTGAASALGLAIDCIRTFGTIVLMGNPHNDTTITLAQHSNILRKELVLQGVWNSHYAATPINEWEFSMHMVDSGKIELEDLITHRTNLDNLPHLCEDIYNQRISICKAVYTAV